MHVILCPYCGVHLKQASPTCPACRRVLPERGPVEEHHEASSPPVWLAPAARRKAGDIRRRIARPWLQPLLDSAMRASVIGGGLELAGAGIEALLGRPAASSLLLASPFLGLACGLAYLALCWPIDFLYQTIIGDDFSTLDFGEGYDGDEAVDGQDTTPEAPGPSTGPKAPAPDADAPFDPPFFITLAAAFAIGYVSEGTVVSALACALFVGAPAGFVLGALAVRLSRPSRTPPTP